MQTRGADLEIRVSGNLRVPERGLILHPRTPGAWRSATVNGVDVPMTEEGIVRVRELPATVVFIH
jgi:hypothetical protein